MHSVSMSWVQGQDYLVTLALAFLCSEPYSHYHSVFFSPGLRSEMQSGPCPLTGVWDVCFRVEEMGQLAPSEESPGTPQDRAAAWAPRTLCSSVDSS